MLEGVRSWFCSAKAFFFKKHLFILFSGAGYSQSQWGMVWLDIDNDGDQDLLLNNGGYEGPEPLRLYRNNAVGGEAEQEMFTDITDSAGLGGKTWHTLLFYDPNTLSADSRSSWGYRIRRCLLPVLVGRVRRGL